MEVSLAWPACFSFSFFLKLQENKRQSITNKGSDPAEFAIVNCHATIRLA
jgi:hypothetical protein